MIHTCQPREKFWRDKRGATERSEPTSEGGPGGTPPENEKKTYIANGAIYVIPELYIRVVVEPWGLGFWVVLTLTVTLTQTLTTTQTPK